VALLQCPCLESWLLLDPTAALSSMAKLYANETESGDWLQDTLSKVYFHWPLSNSYTTGILNLCPFCFPSSSSFFFFLHLV
jgi:hypothetical protein